MLLCGLRYIETGQEHRGHSAACSDKFTAFSSISRAAVIAYTALGPAWSLCSLGLGRPGCGLSRKNWNAAERFCRSPSPC